MKRSYLLPLLVFSPAICLAQVTGGKSEGELLSSDPLNGKQHYKYTSFSLKKDQKAIFFIESDAFKPYIALMTQKGEFIKTGSLNDKETEALVSFAPEKDTSVMVIYSSKEENKTGKFIYGYKVMDSSKMFFSEDFSFCQRFAYLFTQWQMEWKFIPGSWNTFVDDNDPEASYRYMAPSHTLVKTGSAKIVDDYREKIYASMIDLNNETRNFYDMTISSIKSCLDLNVWTIEKEEKDIKGLVTTTHLDITHFVAKGSKRDDRLFSFKLIFKSGLLDGNEVTFVLN